VNHVLLIGQAKTLNGRGGLSGTCRDTAIAALTEAWAKAANAFVLPRDQDIRMQKVDKKNQENQGKSGCKDFFNGLVALFVVPFSSVDHKSYFQGTAESHQGQQTTLFSASMTGPVR
jgi:hypothetical protein